jgi:hypothetical protein
MSKPPAKTSQFMIKPAVKTMIPASDKKQLGGGSVKAQFKFA